MRQWYQYQVLLLLALSLPSSGFTRSSYKTATTSASSGRNIQQLRRHSIGTELLPTQAARMPSSIDSVHRSSSSRQLLPLLATPDDSSSENENNDEEGKVETSESDIVPNWKRVLFFYKYNKDGSLKSKDDDGLTFKQKLAKMGLSVLLSYGFVSNMSYCVTVSLAWFGFSKKTGLSPLAPGQWKGFLAVYAGFYVFNNFVRPMRLAASVGVAPYFERAVSFIQRKTKLNKGASVGVVVFLANVCGTTSLMSLGIYIASLAAGVPIFVPKV